MSTRQERWFGIALIALGLIGALLWATVDATLGAGVCLLAVAGVMYLTRY